MPSTRGSSVQPPVRAPPILAPISNTIRLKGQSPPRTLSSPVDAPPLPPPSVANTVPPVLMYAVRLTRCPHHYHLLSPPPLLGVVHNNCTLRVTQCPLTLVDDPMKTCRCRSWMEMGAHPHQFTISCTPTHPDQAPTTLLLLVCHQVLLCQRLSPLSCRGSTPNYSFRSLNTREIGEEYNR